MSAFFGWASLNKNEMPCHNQETGSNLILCLSPGMCINVAPKQDKRAEIKLNSDSKKYSIFRSERNPL
jgi:hypothetical protein